jgi:hypothetical protein
VSPCLSATTVGACNSHSFDRHRGDFLPISPPSRGWAKRPKAASCTAQDGSCELHQGRRLFRVAAARSLAEAAPDVAVFLDAELSGFDSSDIAFGSSTVLGVWRCDKGGHTWCATPNSLTNARHPAGCGICDGKVVIPSTSLAAVAPWLARQWDTEANGGVTAFQVAPNDNRLYWWACAVAADHRWEASPNNRYGKGSGCRMCSGQEASSTNNLTLNALLMDQWDWEKNTERGLHPVNLTRGAKVEADWVCATYSEHVWPAMVDHRARGQGCPDCSRNHVSDLNSLASVAPQLAEQFDCLRNETTPDQVAASSNRDYWWICPLEPERHGWEAQPNNRMRLQQGCPDCFTPGSSAQEVRLAHEIATVIPFDLSEHSVQLRSGRTSKVDIVITDLKMAVEFDGSYWHRDKVENDSEKTRALRDAGWVVVRVREAPLTPIDLNWDVQIPKLASPHMAACLVLEHLSRLGFADVAGVGGYVQRGFPAAAGEAELALDSLRQQAEARVRKKRREQAAGKP